jgi:hypothetical protein
VKGNGTLSDEVISVIQIVTLEYSWRRLGVSYIEVQFKRPNLGPFTVDLISLSSFSTRSFSNPRFHSSVRLHRCPTVNRKRVFSNQFPSAGKLAATKFAQRFSTERKGTTAESGQEQNSVRKRLEIEEDRLGIPVSGSDVEIREEALDSNLRSLSGSQILIMRTSNAILASM